jgi:hypothetical protein
MRFEGLCLYHRGMASPFAVASKHLRGSQLTGELSVRGQLYTQPGALHSFALPGAASCFLCFV